MCVIYTMINNPLVSFWKWQNSSECEAHLFFAVLERLEKDQLVFP